MDIKRWPALATVLRAAAMLPADGAPWPWLEEVATLRHQEIAAFPGAFGDLRRWLEGQGMLAVGPVPEVARFRPAAAEALAAIPDAPDADALAPDLRTAVGRRVQQFKKERQQLFQKVVKGDAGPEAQDGWYVAPLAEVQAKAAAVGGVEVTPLPDGSFVLSLKEGAAWEEAHLHAFIRRQFANDDPDAVAWALRTAELSADDLEAARERILALAARNPDGVAEIKLTGLLLLEQARIDCSRGADRSAWHGAGKAVEVFQKLHEHCPADPEVAALLDEAKQAQWGYDW